MILIAAFFICLDFLAISASAACPPAKDIYPCDCINEYDYLEIRCFDIHMSRDELLNALKKVDSDEDILLNVKNMELGALTSTFFEGLRITKIEIENCKLENLTVDGGKPFSGLENILSELEITSTFTERNGIKTLDFSHLNKLTDLVLTGNAFEDLNDNWFINGPRSLLHLDLSNSNFNHIGQKVFSNLLNLEVLKLEGNRFFYHHLARSMFPNPAKLEKLYLNDCFISTIEEGLFSNMPFLKIITLKSNLISTVEEKTFGPIWPQLEILDLRENHLNCDERMEWMKGKDKKPEHVIGTCVFPKPMKELDEFM